MPESLHEAIRLQIEQALRQVNSCTLGKVVSIKQGSEEDPNATVDAIPLIMEIDETGNEYPPAKIFDCPILVFGSKEVNVSVDVQVGDIGLLLFTNTEVQGWNINRTETSVSQTYEKMSSSNAAFLPLSLGQYSGNALSIEAAQKLILLANENSTMKDELDRVYDTMTEMMKMWQELITAVGGQNPVMGSTIGSLTSKIVPINNKIIEAKNKVRKIFTDTYGEASGEPATNPPEPSAPKKGDNKINAAISAIVDAITNANTMAVAGNGSPLGAFSADLATLQSAVEALPNG